MSDLVGAEELQVIAAWMERLTEERDAFKGSFNAAIKRIAKLETVIKGATEYGEVAFMGVNIPFKQFRLLKEALQEVDDE